jgi:hypothetical protein
MKLECEWGLGLNLELQAMIVGVTTLGFANQDLMMPNLSKLSTPPRNVGEFFRPHPLNFFLCVHCAFNTLLVSCPCLCFKNQNLNYFEN